MKNLWKRWFPPNDWETISSSSALIIWSDQNDREETLAMYHLQFSKYKNRYRVECERISKSYLLRSHDVKDHKLYFEVLKKCNELNVKKMNKELREENSIARDYPEDIDN